MYFLLRKLLTLIYHIMYNLSFEGLENIPAEGGKIYASNHRSMADPVLLTLPVRKRFCYMAKEELFRNPLFGALIRALGAYPVVRGSGGDEIIEESVRRLRTGRNLGIYPEGTRSKDGRLGKCKSGIVLIAAKTGADIIPVGVNFEGKLHFRSRVVVRFGKPIPAAELSLSEGRPSIKEIRAVKSRIMGEIALLVDQPPLPAEE